MPTLTRSLFLVALAAACATTDADAPSDETDSDSDAETDTEDTDDTNVTACTVTPGSWSAPDWDTNAATALGLRARIDVLAVTAMREGEQGTRTFSGIADLEALMEAGDPSLDELVTDAYAPVVADAFADYLDVLAAGAVDLVDDGDGSFVGGEAGGIFGTSLRGIQEGGLESRQLVDKGLFGGGLLYPWALALTEGPISPATMDAIAAAYGADATLTAAGTLTDSASYAAGIGLFEAFAGPLADAKAYAADPDCDAERDAALVEAFRAWEFALVGRTVFYVNGAAARMASASSENDVAEAIHGVSEGIGLLAGLVGVPDPSSGPLAGGAVRATDADLTDMLDALGVELGDLSGATTGEICASPTALAAAQTALETEVKGTYGLSDEDIADLRAPPVD